MGRKDDYIAELEAEVSRMRNELLLARTGKKEVKPPKVTKCFSIALDLWPPSEWFRFKWYGWNPGRYAQLYIGPLRVDFFEG